MDKQIAPQQEYVSPPGIVAGQRPIPAALRKEPPALKTDSERDAEIERIAALLGHDSNGSEFTQALAAIRRLYAPPALPAEVEAVVDILKRIVTCGVKQYRFTYGSVEDACADAATLLRRYAQAVAENDAKLQAVEALCAEAEAMQPPTLVGPQSILIAKIRKILREEH